MKTVIMAGGRGTRIKSLENNLPKPMIKIEGRPVLEHELICLKKQGFTDFLITVSYLGDSIMDYFEDGRNLGVQIEYYVEKKPLGNAGALFKIKEKLTDDFLLLNADLVFDVDFNRFVNYHKKYGGQVTIFTHPNSHPYDSALIAADEHKAVTKWITKEEMHPLWYRNRVNAGLHVMKKALLDTVDIKQEQVGIPDGGGNLFKVDLDRQLLKPLAGTGKMFCYDSPEYVRDMGTPERYEAVCKDFKTGIIQAKNLQNKQKAVFLDRDGTINKHIGFLWDIEDFKLLPGVADAIKRMNALEYLVIVITNQPVIARGEVSWEELEKIHNKMETLLGREGAYLDGIYFCPHHPDKGYAGEIAELKVPCGCRKPNPGMLFQAAEDFHIDLKRSWVIGDSESDIKAGKAAGCRTILLGFGDFGQDEEAGALNAGVVDFYLKDDRIKTHVDTLIRRYPALGASRNEIIKAYLLLEECYCNDGKLLVAGNGGSAADAEHIAGELMKRFRIARHIGDALTEKLKEADPIRGESLAANLECSLMAIPLVAHEALTTAYINDVDGLGVFAQQLFGFGRRGDVFLGISTSGNSENILNAVAVARALEIKSIGLTGIYGGELSEKADITIKVPESETYKVQELHLPVYHCLCLMLEDRFFGS